MVITVGQVLAIITITVRIVAMAVMAAEAAVTSPLADQVVVETQETVAATENQVAAVVPTMDRLETVEAAAQVAVLKQTSHTMVIVTVN